MPRWPAFVIALILNATPALGWSKATHTVSGAIAYDILAVDNPEALKEVVRILRAHPTYKKHFSRRMAGVPEENQDRFMLMIAAQWPDDIRGNDQYDHGAWHFINYPILAKQDEGTLKAPEPAEENIISAYDANVKILAESKDDGERAIAICWILHLIGDAHQPLHTVSFFNSVHWPAGDRGGNNFFIRVQDGGDVINLHQLWDGLLGGSEGYQEPSNQAIELRLRPGFSRDQLCELNNNGIQAWVDESRELAIRVAYQDGTLQGNPSRDNGPVLPEGYAPNAKAIAERRIVLSGYRMAASLRGILNSPTPTTAPSP